MPRPGDVVDISVVGEQLQQLLRVDPVVSGEGGRPHVPERDHPVIGPTEQPGGLRAVEDQTVDGRVLLLYWLPLVKTNLGVERVEVVIIGPELGLTLLAGWNILISPLMPPLARMLVFSSCSLRVVLEHHSQSTQQTKSHYTDSPS